jgi:hypothetical protein
MRNALYHWARVSVQHDDHSREHYAQLRKVGHRHGRALRGVADRLLPVLMAMLKSRTLYDPQRRTPTLAAVNESPAGGAKSVVADLRLDTGGSDVAPLFGSVMTIPRTIRPFCPVEKLVGFSLLRQMGVAVRYPG